MIRCSLCPRRCRIAGGAEGRCHVRRARMAPQVHQVSVDDSPGFVLELPYYGCISALAADPIEKKPLYHWRPGSSIVSAGFVGCNFHCPFCQNWRISQITGGETGGSCLKPEELIAKVKAGSKDRQIAYTYSEPLVHAEYLCDCMEEAHGEGIANVLVTNGCVSAGAAEEILSRTDAANIDLKCFSQKNYSAVLGGNLEAVLDFIHLAVSTGVHTEITTLVVPDLNDSEAELMKIAEFIAGMSRVIPWHLSAYHPDWKWNAPPTEPAFLSAIAENAQDLLAFVYTGNIAGTHNDTACQRCGAKLVTRRGYRCDASGLCLQTSQKENDESLANKKKPVFYTCAACGEAAPIRWN